MPNACAVFQITKKFDISVNFAVNDVAIKVRIFSVHFEAVQINIHGEQCCHV